MRLAGAGDPSTYARLSMCGRYTNTLGPEEFGKQLGERFGVQIRETTDGDPYNVAPTEHVLAILAPKGQPQARLLRWGLVPSWAHELKQRHLMINARIESARSNPVYRELIHRASRRALQIADGYYEWIKPEKPSEPRQPFYFQVERRRPVRVHGAVDPGEDRRRVDRQLHDAHLQLGRQPRGRGDPRPYAGDPRRPRRSARVARPCRRRRGCARALRTTPGQPHDRPAGQPSCQQGRWGRRARAACGARVRHAGIGTKRSDALADRTQAEASRALVANTAAQR